MTSTDKVMSGRLVYPSWPKRTFKPVPPSVYYGKLRHQVQDESAHAHMSCQAKGTNGPVYRGQLKFFYDSQDYGFLICGETGKDVFFHFDDMAETCLSRYQLIMGSNKPNIAANVGRIRMTVHDEVRRLAAVNDCQSGGGQRAFQ